MRSSNCLLQLLVTLWNISQLTFSCRKSTMGALKKVWNMFNGNSKNTRATSLTFHMFHTFFQCFYRWLLTSKCWLGCLFVHSKIKKHWDCLWGFLFHFHEFCFNKKATSLRDFRLLSLFKESSSECVHLTKRNFLFSGNNFDSQ